MDIDVLDPTDPPGTGTPEAGGITSLESLEIIHDFRAMNLVGADVVEVAPAYDHAELMGNAVSHVAYELVTLMADSAVPGDRFDAATSSHLPFLTDPATTSAGPRDIAFAPRTASATTLTTKAHSQPKAGQTMTTNSRNAGSDKAQVRLEDLDLTPSGLADSPALQQEAESIIYIGNS